MWPFVEPINRRTSGKCREALIILYAVDGELSSRWKILLNVNEPCGTMFEIAEQRVRNTESHEGCFSLFRESTPTPPEGVKRKIVSRMSPKHK